MKFSENTKIEKNDFTQERPPLNRLISPKEHHYKEEKYDDETDM